MERVDQNSEGCKEGGEFTLKEVNNSFQERNTAVKIIRGKGGGQAREGLHRQGGGGGPQEPRTTAAAPPGACT